MGKYDSEIKQEQQEVRVWRECYQSRESEIKDKIDEYLNQEKYNELISYFTQAEVADIAVKSGELGNFTIILNIYKMEQEEKQKEKILEGIHSMKEAEEFYLKLKFLMWRIEFRDESQEFMRFVKEHPISLSFLKYLIHTSSFEKVNTAFKIAMLLKENEYYGKAFGMLNYVNELSPNEEVVYCEMADICMKNQQYREAIECIKQITQPTEIFLQYEQKWEI